MKIGPNIVGGNIKRGSSGKLSTTENSGHFGHNWTLAIRARFVEFMREHGVEVNHAQW